MRALRLYAGADGGGRAAGGTPLLVVFGEVTPAGETAEGASYVARDGERTVTTLGLGADADRLVLREGAAFADERARALPLTSPGGALLGALVVADGPPARGEPARLALCADILAALLERRRRERVATRVARALDALPALAATADDESTPLDVCRRTLDAVCALASPTAVLLLARDDDGRLRAPGGTGAEDGEPLTLDSIRSA